MIPQARDWMQNAAHLRTYKEGEAYSEGWLDGLECALYHVAAYVKEGSCDKQLKHTLAEFMEQAIIKDKK